MSNADVEARIRKRAITLLASREHASRALRQKLKRKFPQHDQEIEAVLEWLIEAGLQSDARYLEQLVRSRIGRGYGPRYVVQEVRAQGLSEDDLAEVEAWNETDWEAVIDAQVARQDLSDRKSWERQVRRLARRGFPSDLVRRAVGEMPI